MTIQASRLSSARAPKGRHVWSMNIYRLEPATLDGTWTPPPVRRVA